MAKGKEFESIVAIITRTLIDEAEVKSPDFLPDIETGELRQVDCSIVSKTGPYSLLIIQEARDRKRPVSVSYVEEVIQKAKSVGAQKAAIVSSKGFSCHARKKAASNRIDLFTLDEAESEDWKRWSWISVEELTVHLRRGEIRDVTIQLDDKVDTKAINLELLSKRYPEGMIPVNDKVFYDGKTGFWFSPSDIMKSSHVEKLFERVKPGAPPVQWKIKLDVSGKEVYVDVGDSKLPIKTLCIRAQAWIEVEESPLKHLAYTRDAQKGQRLAEYAEASFEHEGEKVSVALVRDKQKGAIRAFGKVSKI